MTTYAIERNDELVNQIVFIGKGLYKSVDIIPLTFSNVKQAKEVSDVLGGIVVDYYQYTFRDVSIAA
jgi:hypothetical protein